MAGKKKSTPIPLQSLDALFGTTSEEQAGIQQIALDNLHPFSNHPFKVLDDDKMAELSESVRTHGVLVPGIVRIKDTGGYEIIAGHRRKRACEIAGLKTMPVIIKDLTDDESTVIMVDSNIQREELLISEKAFAYKMKYDALKRQGKRSDLTSCQVGKKLAAEEVSQNTGDSTRQILRYIHLTELIPEMLCLADNKKIPFNTAVELSYLKLEEQKLLLQYMNNHAMTLCDKMKKLFDTYGYYKEGLSTVTLKGQDGAKAIQAMMKKIRSDVPKKIGNKAVLQFRDYQENILFDCVTKEQTVTGLPKSNVLYFELEDHAWCCVRPSGTEPKIKFYIGVKGCNEKDAEEQLSEMMEAVKELAE